MPKKGSQNTVEWKIRLQLLVLLYKAIRYAMVAHNVLVLHHAAEDIMMRSPAPTRANPQMRGPAKLYYICCYLLIAGVLGCRATGKPYGGHIQGVKWEAEVQSSNKWSTEMSMQDAAPASAKW